MERFAEILRTYREAFVRNIKTRIQYFHDNSTLQTFGYVISLTYTPLFKRLFWLVTMSACCYCSAVVLRGALALYTQDAVSYSVETDYLRWNTPFPAITICEYVNTTNVKSFLEKNHKKSSLTPFVKEIAFWNLNFCKPCTNCKMDINCIEDFIPIVDMVRSPCEDLMTECSFNGEQFPCCERFKPMPTEYGVCFVFNSHITGDGKVSINRSIGLPTLTFTIIAKVTMKVHSPYERVSVETENILPNCYTLVTGIDVEAHFAAEEIINDASVRSIAPNSRDCRFEDEIPETLEGWPFEEYSYSGCVWYCRTMAQVQMCNCSHHFMPKIANVPVCNIQGLKCLYTNRKSIEVDEKCHCPMSCSEVTYSVIYGSCKVSNANVPRNTIVGSVKIGQVPHLRVRRQAIRDMLGLVVDVGGVVGVFFGASLLSFIEIVYIFCIRKYR